MYTRFMYNNVSRACISIFRNSSAQPKQIERTEIGKALYPNRKEDKTGVSRLWDKVKSLVSSDSEDPDAETEKYFQFSVERLMASPGRFTFEKFHTYLEELCTKLRIIGKRTIPESDITGPLLQLRNQYRMMSVLTKTELESDSYKVFSFENKRLIAQATNLTINDVEEMLLHHDVCKTDRTWYFRRLALGRSLPSSHSEREFLAYQRPIGRLAQQSYPKTDSLEAIKVRETWEKIPYKKQPYVLSTILKAII
ncbi:conserved hypothetical protein [Theileria equi strain WA]|uniref:Uncharacterized protein n=1 Tax=Theileria equi strain WA TaxID=1537102 RepID=L1LGH5_THEEQ|nr:conserved hypothetical protein [Theileria equi strain WA]EKX74238.1 conserved hypothetical protein [Theileria equi strain WA]|eukprot:XP_004833690.1 conserved hypothetical protein [Theileria equi strain WA]